MTLTAHLITYRLIKGREILLPSSVSAWQCCFIYRTTILPDVLYGCETWSLTLREEHRLRVFRRIMFGPKRDALTGEWRKLQTRSVMFCIAHPKVKVKSVCGSFSTYA
jgi:hypothetical protein